MSAPSIDEFKALCASKRFTHYETSAMICGVHDGETAVERALETATDRLMVGAALTEFFALARIHEARKRRPRWRTRVMMGGVEIPIVPGVYSEIR